jgi:hypothetical protein
VRILLGGEGGAFGVVAGCDASRHLVAGRADDQGDVGRRAGAQGVERLLWQEGRAGDRPPGHGRDGGGEVGGHAGFAEPDEAVDGKRAEARSGVGRVRAAEMRGGLHRTSTSLGAGDDGVGARRALDDGPVEQPAGVGRGELCARGEAAGGLAPERHVARVAAEGADVVAHPAQGGLLVGEPEVADCRVVEAGVGEESQCSQSVVDGDRDDLSLARDALRVVEPALARRPAAVEEQHHREGSSRAAWAVDVQVEAVLGALDHRAAVGSRPPRLGARVRGSGAVTVAARHALRDQDPPGRSAPADGPHPDDLG